MKPVRITINNYPFKGDLAYALANRDDMERKYQKIEIPDMSYPKSRMTPVSLKAFMSLILP